MQPYYKNKPEQYFRAIRQEILPLLPRTLARIADVGGASGATLDAIKQTFPSAVTICVDLHEASLATARKNGHQTIACNLELEIPAALATCDTVLCLDVLEHLADPWTVLKRIVDTLPAGATVIVSLPNVRFMPVSAGLFFLGRWNLMDMGVLDRTHLRFFTRTTAGALVNQAGLVIGTIRRKYGGHGERLGRILNILSLGLLSDLWTVQYLIAATVSGERVV